MKAHKDMTEQSFTVSIESTGRSEGTMRNVITSKFARPDAETWEMVTDEGAFHGGDATAPPPLAYFATALVGCLMTQIRAFSKSLDTPVASVTATARIKWRGRQIGSAPYRTEPIGIGIDLDIESPAEASQLAALIEAAKQGCFIEQTLVRENTITHRLKSGQTWIDV